MGQQSFVSRKPIDSSARQRRRIALDFDVPLLLVTVTLLAFGLIMVYSASWDFSYLLYDDPSRIIIRQILFVIAGVLVAGFLTFFDYRWLRRLAIPIMIVTIVALLAVLLFGETRLNATRTLFGGSIQPSELAKLATVIYLAVWLHSKRDQLDTWGFGLLPLAVILGLVGALIFLQPDLSATMTVILLGGILFFLAGGDMRRILILVLLTVVIGWMFVMVSPTGQDRVTSYIAGLGDPTKASYHVQRSLEAFVKGGFFGVGIGKADTKLTGLPVPPTDSIFAVVGEETGMIGAIVLLGLFLLLLWRSLIIAQRAPDAFGSLLAAGLGLWLVMEAFINMAVIVGLLPFAGNALPFMSAGGSSMLVSLASIGILMNIARSGTQEKVWKDSILNAFSNLRRRDRRRRVSRPRRPSGTPEN
jgi:cell division protein FtsW